MRVGSESAGATPGPACYGKGGKEPTVSDANLVLVYLPSKLLGGTFKLDVDAAVAAVDTLAAQMGLPREKTAEGIISLANETIYGAVRLVSVEQGHDPRDFAWSLLAEQDRCTPNLGAWPVIIPPAPGVLGAQGDATTEISHVQTKSYIKLLSETNMNELEKEYGNLERSCVKMMISQLRSAS